MSEREGSLTGEMGIENKYFCISDLTLKTRQHKEYYRQTNYGQIYLIVLQNSRLLEQVQLH